MSKSATARIPATNKKYKAWNVVIETPKGCRNKYKFNEEAEVFSLSGVLPAGAVFPFDFGYLPATLGPDGDPLDVLLLMDEPAFVGCLIPARLIGVIEADQTERDGKTTRNDRLIAVPCDSQEHRKVCALKDLNPTVIQEVEHFFVSYNQQRGKKFKVLGKHGPSRAEKIAKEGVKAHAKKNSSGK